MFIPLGPHQKKSIGGKNGILKKHKQDPEKNEVDLLLSGGGIVISRRDGVRSRWDGVRLEGHGWDGKAREMEKQGRVVGMEDSGKKKRLRPGSDPGTEQKSQKTRGK